MAIIIAMSSAFTVVAENEDSKSQQKQEKEQVNEESKNEEKEKPEEKSDDESQDEPEEEPEHVPHAKYILVCDAQNGYKLYSKGSNEIINPYGFTKILTAITVIENQKDLNKEITVPKNILKDYDYTNSNIGLASGEKISIRSLLHAMMMHDAGDCAVALAHVTGKSYDEFIKLINDTAKKAGAKKSVFTDPAGFVKGTQKTTLEDMCKITTYALKNDTFREIVTTEQYNIPANNKRKNKKILFPKNKFISRYYTDEYINTSIRGVKEYYVDGANTGLISRYVNGSDDLLILVAQSDKDSKKDYVYDDTLKLIELHKGFFENIRYIKKEEFVSESPVNNAKNTERALIVALNDITIRIPKEYDRKLITREIVINKEIKAPLQKFEEVGEIKVYYNNTLVGSAPIATYHKLERSFTKTVKNCIIKLLSSFIFWIILVVIIIVRRNKNKNKNSN